MISQRAKRAGLKELEIFDSFQIDRNLPKHKSEENNQINGGVAFSNDINSVWMSIPVSDGSVDENYGKKSIRTIIGNWILGKTKKVKVVRRKKISILEFFTSLSKSFQELTPIAEIAEHYEKALIQAKTMGQQSLVESLENIIDIARGEAHLIAMGLKKYVSEKQVVDFYDKVGEDKNLKLTWIKNFGRIIPESIYEIKKSVDERNIFDNYVILHYDPANNGENLTKKEVEKKKDPILFGVIKNSKKLYYIADWKDEYCELTLEEMFKTLKGKVLQINNKSVKTFIDKTTI